MSLYHYCLSRYGFQFLYEAYLYHFTRTDNRHNFSVYFYDLYLRYCMMVSLKIQADSYVFPTHSYNTPAGFGLGLLAFLPQVASLVVISLRYGQDLGFALFALTMVFVVFNKVCTAQVRRSKLTAVELSHSQCLHFCLGSSTSCGTRRSCRWSSQQQACVGSGRAHSWCSHGSLPR